MSAISIQAINASRYFPFRKSGSLPVLKEMAESAWNPSGSFLPGQENLSVSGGPVHKPPSTPVISIVPRRLIGNPENRNDGNEFFSMAAPPPERDKEVKNRLKLYVKLSRTSEKVDGRDIMKKINRIGARCGCIPCSGRTAPRSHLLPSAGGATRTRGCSRTSGT